MGQPPAQANLALSIVLLAVFFIQAAFNAWQDWSSSRVMASITTMLPDKCLVKRDGVQVTIVASEIVPGDILLIRAGNKLPADVRFLETSSDAKFDRSILSGRISLLFLSKFHVCTFVLSTSLRLGESLPLSAAVDSTDDNYLETRCIGMQGTHCISGTALGVVVSTGDATVFGRIAMLTNEPKPGMTTLEREVLRFVVIICSSIICTVVGVVILW